MSKLVDEMMKRDIGVVMTRSEDSEEVLIMIKAMDGREIDGTTVAVILSQLA